MEKIDMSLDDIIRLQRKERRKQKAGAKKVTLATKPHRPVRGRKPPRQGISPLNRSLTAIQPTSVINGQKAYSARYLKPRLGRTTTPKKSFSSMRSDQLQADGGANRPVRQRLKLKRGQNMTSVVNRSLPTQQRFKQRKRANSQANLAATRTQNRQQKFNQRRRSNGQTINTGQRQQRQQQRPNQRRQKKTTNNNSQQPKQQQQRSSQRQQQMKRTQTQSQTRKTRQIQQPRPQQQTAGPTKRSVGMLKVSISTSSNTQNGPVKLKRNAFYNSNTPNRPNNRVNRGGRRQKQQVTTEVAERTVIF